MKEMKFTAVLEREGDGFVSHYLELGIASEGRTEKEARENLREAVELFLEHAGAAEVAGRLSRS